MLCTSASIFHISVTAADDETVKVALEALKEGFSEGCTTQVIGWRYVLHGKIRRFSSTKNRKIEEAYSKSVSKCDCWTLWRSVSTAF